MRIAIVLGLATMVACKPSARAADSTQPVATVDTVKPDTVKPDTTSTAARPETTSTKSTKTKTTVSPGATKSKSAGRATTARDTTHLGRDSVIRFDPNDPRRRLPTVPRKPPQ